MDAVILIGRILFGAVFLGGALGHFTQADTLAGYAESKGVKPGKLAVLGAGVWMLVGGLLVIVGAWPDLGALMLAVFLLPTAFVMHAYWREQDPQARFSEQAHFNKDISLAGAALALFGFFVTAGATTGLQLTGPLFGALAG